MFAAQSGAKKVYAVDASAVAFKAERNIKANGFSEVITCVNNAVLPHSSHDSNETRHLSAWSRARSRTSTCQKRST